MDPAPGLAPLVSRAANRLKRQLHRLPGVRAYKGYEYLEALETHSLRLPPVGPADLSVLDALRRHGALAVPVESLAVPGTRAMLDAGEQLAEELRAMPADGSNAPRLPIARLMELPEIYLWGLHPRLLDLVENYIGLPILYHGADLRREVADGRSTDVRQWHIDVEDRRMLKIIVYLHDVTPGGGPFEYLPRERTIEAARRLHYVSGFVDDDRMSATAPRPSWIAALGRSRTALLADTCRVFHRAQPPLLDDRYSITFSWTSTTAVKTYPSAPLPREAYEHVFSRTEERQRACLPARESR